LQLLDDGRLTDGHGRTVDFRNTVIIMTSNVGSNVIASEGWEGAAGDASGGAGRGGISDAMMGELRRTFRPEFLNRVDEIVIFHALSREDLRKIVDIAAQGLTRMLAEREIRLTLTDRARDALADEGFDPHFGARPLKRTLQRRVQNPLAMKLLKGEFKPGQTVEVDFEKGEVVFRAVPAPEPARV
jgi:ATP-dependent Clp protease ATP-binding subunit ClpA